MKLEPAPEILKERFDSDSLIYNDDKFLFYNKDVDKNIIKDIKEHTLQVYGGYYIFNKGDYCPTIFLIGRGENAGKFKFKVQNFLPYCYENDDEGDYKTYLGRRCKKMIFKGMHPSKIKFYREMRRRKNFPLPYEADILFVRRFLCDMYDYFKPKEAIEPKIAVVDIETNHPISNDIIAFSVNDMENYMYYESKFDDSSRLTLALSLLENIKKYDWFTGWNVKFDAQILMDHLEIIDGFVERVRLNEGKLNREDLLKGQSSNAELDEMIEELVRLKYLVEDKNGLLSTKRYFDPDPTHHSAMVDLMIISKKMHAKEIRGNWSLDNVGNRLCGIGKKHIGATRIGDLSEEDLFEYNTLDVIIPELIDATLGGLETHLILSWSLQCIVEDTLITAVVNDIALIRAYHRAGLVLPTREFRKNANKDAGYKAAEPDARPGLYKGIISTDLVHAYPWAVISKNVSPETKDSEGENVAPNGVKFNNGRSIFIETLKEIMDDRSRVKNKLEKLTPNSNKWKKYKSIDFALKTQAAAFSHGIFGWENSRMRDIEVADAITSIVRELITTIKNACDMIDKKWIYAHTDSCYINAPEDEAERILEYLDKVMISYCKGYKIKPNLEYKDYFKIGYIHSPARNVLVQKDADVDDSESWNVTGMNFMRSETPLPLADIEINLLKSVFKGLSKDDLVKELKEMIKKLITKESTELATIKPMTKDLSSYGKIKKDGTMGGYPYHISALMRAEDEYGFMVNVGEKFGVLPIITDEYEGKKIRRRKKVFMAFDLEKGLPDNYIIDYTNYLRSNLWGKVCKMFDMKAKDLEKRIMEDDVRACLFAGML